MKNLEIPKYRDAEPAYVTDESKNARNLFYKTEKTMECIAYTNAVDYCITLSLNNPYDNDGHFDTLEFYSGKYDNDELLVKLCVDSRLFFETYKDRFIDTDDDIIEIIKEEYSKYDFAKNYKYLTLFVEYLNSKKLEK